MNYNEMDDNRSRIFIGNLTVYLILAVSFAATIAYWVVLAGLENSRDLPSGWYLLLWLIVGVGAVAEVIKKVTLSTYRNTLIWLLATAVSVLTVMGTYAILNSTRQDQITKSSDAYQDGRALKQKGLDDAAKYAHAAGYNLDELDAQLKRVICLRGSGHGAGAECGGGKSISYSSYLNQKKAIQAKIADAKAYQRAMSTADMGKQTMAAGGSTGTSSNPLLSDISSAIGVSEKSIINTFYLAVTLLLEFAAFFIGGQVEELKRAQRYSERELQELKNKALFGVTIAELMGYEAPTLAEQRAQETPKKEPNAVETTPVFGAGVGVGTDGIGAGVGAGIMATPKAEAPKTPKPEASEKPVIQAKSAPDTKKENQPKQKPGKTEDVAPKPEKQASYMEGIGFKGKLIQPTSDTKAYRLNRVTAKSNKATPQDESPLSIGKTHPDSTEGQPLSDSDKPTHKPSVKTITEGTNDPRTRVTEGDKRVDTSKLYQDWVSDLKSGQVRPSVSASWKWLQQRVSKSQSIKKAPTPQHMTEIVQLFIRRAIHEQVLINNPKYRNGLPKYLLKENEK